MSQEFIFVLSIILLVGIISTVKMIVRHRLGIPHGSGREGRRGQSSIESAGAGETARLRDEVKSLKERLHTLERITVDKENSLSREIESLRDR